MVATLAKFPASEGVAVPPPPPGAGTSLTPFAATVQPIPRPIGDIPPMPP